MEYDRVTEQIIRCAFDVQNTLGAGFLEKVYENSLVYELKKRDMIVEQQKQIQVFYDGVVVGDYYADIFVNQTHIVELKAVKKIDDIYIAQVLNYLKAIKVKTGLLLNFGSPRLEIKRLSV